MCEWESVVDPLGLSAGKVFWFFSFFLFWPPGPCLDTGAPGCAWTRAASLCLDASEREREREREEQERERERNERERERESERRERVREGRE